MSQVGCVIDDYWRGGCQWDIMDVNIKSSPGIEAGVAVRTVGMWHVAGSVGVRVSSVG